MSDKYLEYVDAYLDRCRTDPGSDVRDPMIIALPRHYYSPNDRFFRHEMYYWDTFFLLKYLQLMGGHEQDILASLDNFAHLIQRFGFIPNANRYDFTSRSQLPLFGMALYETGNLNAEYLAALATETAWWSQYPHPKYQAFKKVSPDSYYRYFADYNEALAACESGWDYSRRWYDSDPDGVPREKLSEIFPVDLNAVMIFNNRLLKQHGYAHDDSLATLLERFNETFWCEDDGFYYDRNFRQDRNTPYRTLAGFVPLYCRLAGQEQAQSVAAHLPDFLHEHGLATMQERSEHEKERFRYEKSLQWDYPNGWAPLHYFVAAGLINYQFLDAAESVMRAFVRGCEHYYDQYQTFPEKVIVDPDAALSHAVYPDQEGFGWTNFVYGMFRLCLDGRVAPEALAPPVLAHMGASE